MIENALILHLERTEHQVFVCGKPNNTFVKPKMPCEGYYRPTYCKLWSFDTAKAATLYQKRNLLVCVCERVNNYKH